MSSEMGRRPMIGDADNHNSFGDEFHNEMGLLLREERRQDADELEQELNLYRSGSAPPTVEGSLSAVGGLFNHGAPDGGNSGGTAIGQGFADFARNKNGNGFSSEEELRSDPNYLSYYYSNVNLNPRLPPPLLSREDWRFAQRLQGGSSAIGDRRKVIGNESSSNGGRSMFSMPPGFKSKKQERENEDEVQGSGVEWSGDGLIGLPGLGLGGKQKSIVEIFQEDLSRATPASAHPSRPSSRNTFAENAFTMGSVEAELANLHQDLVASTPTIQSSSAAPAMYSYAAALGGTLSRSSTPDPQRIARAPSPCPIPIGGGRTVNPEKRTTHSPDFVVALSGMSLSTRDADDRTNYLCNLDGGHNNPRRHAYHTKKNENLQFSNSSPPSITTDLGGPHLVDNLQYQHLERPDRSSFSNYGLGGYPVSPLPSQLGSSNLCTHSPFTDTLYLQYLRAAEYAAAAAQVAAMNDPSVDMNYMGNSYTNLIQKAYQKSQYGASSPHGYYMNPSFDIGLQYPGSPMGSPGPIMRASGSGPGSPLRHVDMNMRFPGAVRNVAGGVIGPWHLDGVENAFASSLLEEFKSNKTRCFELLEIAGHVVEFSADQYGSRFIQQKLETATTEEKSMVFQEIFPQALALMTDVFGNYVIQKFFEHGMMSQRRELAGKLFGHVLNLSLQMYGCRVIQKAIEVVDVDQKIKMVEELDGHVMRCVRDQNGNHVIQKCIECVPEEHIQFIVSTFFDQVVTLSTHPYGCRVIQRVLEHCKDEKTQNKAMEEILGAVSMLAQDQYGNYVVQHVLEHGKPHERSAIIQELAGKIVPMSQQKFASNVVEKCLTFGDAGECQLLVNEMLGTTDENEPLQAMMKDQFANYVVQKVLETCSDQQRELIMSRIKVHLNALKRYTYGKHIVARVEKLVAAGERRIAAQTQQSA